MYAGKMTIDNILENEYRTAYFTFAPYMRHGPHLPLTASIKIAQAIAVEIGRRIGAFVLPVQPFAPCLEFSDRYNVCVDSGLLYNMILDIARNLQRQGFTRLVLHQGFWGTSILYHATRHINATENIKTVFVNPTELAASHGGVLQGVGDVHAGELHTSLMMYLHEDCVNADKIDGIDYIPDANPKCLNYKSLDSYCPNGVWGRPSLAGADKGRKLFIQAVELSVIHISEAFAFMDRNSDYTGGRETQWRHTPQWKY